MLKVKLDGETGGTVGKSNEVYLETKNDVPGILAIGTTWIDITRGIEAVTTKCDAEKPMKKYTIMLFIFKDLLNSAVQYVEIESQLRRYNILKVFFRYIKCDPHTSEKIIKRGKRRWQHFHRDEDHDVLYLVEHLIEIYVAESDGKSYRDDFIGAMSFIHRTDEEIGERCPLM